MVGTEQGVETSVGAPAPHPSKLRDTRRDTKRTFRGSPTCASVPNWRYCRPMSDETRVLLHPVGPAQITRTTPAGDLHVLTAEQTPALFVVCAYLACTGAGHASRSDIREHLYRGNAPAFRQALQRLRQRGWIEEANGDADMLHLVGAPAILPGRDPWHITDWMRTTPGRVLVLDGVESNLAPEWLEWLDELREQWQAQILAQLEYLGDQAWTASDIAGGRAITAHIEAIEPEAPILRHWRVRRTLPSATFPSNTPRAFAARWPELARPTLEARLATRLRTPADPRVMLLHGEAGIGKSVLLNRLLTAAAAWGKEAPRVLRTNGQWMPPVDLATSWRPSSGLADLLRNLLEMRGAIGAQGYGMLHSRVVLGHEALGELSSDDLIAATLDVLTAVREASGRPLWWVLDDLHFIDDAVVRVINASLQEHRGTPWAVLAASRETPPSVWREMEQRGQGAWDWVQVPFCDPSHIHVVSTALGISVADATSVFDIAKGHPFRWYEMTRRLVAGDEVGADVSLEQLLLEEVRTWPGETQRVAGAIVLAGDRAFPDVVATATQVSTEDAEALMDRLVARDVAARHTTIDGKRWVITADRWRDAIMRALEGSMTTQLHARLAHAFQTHPILRERVDVRIARLAHLCGAHAVTEALAEAPGLVPACAALGAIEDGVRAWRVVLEIAHDTYGSLPSALRDQYAELCLNAEIADDMPRYATPDTQTLIEQVLYVALSEASPTLALTLLPRVRAELPERLHLVAAVRTMRALFNAVPWQRCEHQLPALRAILASYQQRRFQQIVTPTESARAAMLLVIIAKLTHEPLSAEIFNTVRCAEGGLARRPLQQLRFLVETTLAAGGHYGAYWDLRCQMEASGLTAGSDWMHDTRWRNDLAVYLAVGDIEHATAAFMAAPPAREPTSHRDAGVTELALAVSQPTVASMRETLTRYASEIEDAHRRLVPPTTDVALRPFRVNCLSLLTLTAARADEDVTAQECLWDDIPYDFHDARHIAGESAHGRWLCALAARGRHAEVEAAVAAHRAHGLEHPFHRGWTASYRALAAYYGHAQPHELLTASRWEPAVSMDAAWCTALATVPTLDLDQLKQALSGGEPLVP